MKTKTQQRHIACPQCGSKARRTTDNLCVDCRCDEATRRALTIPDAKTQHTPGPWEYDTIHSMVKDSNGFYLARSDFNKPKDEAIANGRLIAAAPELLEATKEASRLIAQAADKEIDPLIIFAVLERLNNVIEKAAGE